MNRLNTCLFLILLVGVLSGCTPNGYMSTTTTTSIPIAISTTTSSTTSTIVQGGTRAVKVIFQATDGGSFDVPSNSGTVPSPGQGQQALRIFNPDGTLLARGGPTSSGWPTWFSSFELGVSGPSNSAAQSPYCATFAGPTESTDLNCNFGNGNSPCGAPNGVYRVSEADCTLSNPTASTGNGGPTDGVYFRAKFNRSTSVLGSSENIMVVVEYAASALNAASANPVACFLNGSFTPENCSDFVWKVFLKPEATSVVQPFLLLAPPMFASVLNSAGQPASLTSGAGVATKQFILPLASNPSLQFLQISRIKSNFPSPVDLRTYCNSRNASAANSPLCAGMIFYSITFYRI